MADRAGGRASKAGKTLLRLAYRTSAPTAESVASSILLITPAPIVQRRSARQFAVFAPERQHAAASEVGAVMRAVYVVLEPQYRTPSHQAAKQPQRAERAPVRRPERLL